MRHVLILVCFLALPACVRVANVRAPDGGEGFAISCSGTANTWADCQQRAGELCGARGYDILDRSAETGWGVAGSSAGFGGGSTHSRSMLIRCR